HILKGWGVDKLADYEFAEANDERGHTDKFAQRLVFLDGIPDFSKIGKFKIGKTIPEMLKNDLALELEAVKMYREAVATCEDLRDYGSSELFEEVLRAEEGHVDHIESMLWQIENMGLENFIQNHTSPTKE
ncbi:MAG: bacterioferritin, partial [Proteobacteria bacterium]|nr:bacterioferritin [Pseudomonadota bacterium]